jgi:hypothetical protein
VRPTNSWSAVLAFGVLVAGPVLGQALEAVEAVDDVGRALGDHAYRLPAEDAELLGFSLQKGGGVHLPEVELAQYPTGKAVGEALGHGIDDPAEQAPQNTPPFPGWDGMMSQARAG